MSFMSINTSLQVRYGNLRTGIREVTVIGIARNSFSYRVFVKGAAVKM